MIPNPANDSRLSLGPSSGAPLRRRELLVIAAVAALPRLSGLGHVSLWLDEILGTLQTSGSFATSWAAMRGVRVHPPLWGIVNWLSQRVTDSETLRRLVPIAFGVATVILLADLTARCLGRRAGLAVAAIAAFSPVHVRFSQELRPYSLGLLFLVLTVWLAQRAARHRQVGDFFLLALGLWGCMASLYVAALALLPAALLVLEAHRGATQAKRGLTRIGLAAAAALIAFLPWLGVVGAALAKEHELAASHWSLDLVARRWQFLTLGAADGEAASRLAGPLAALAALGAVAAAGSAFGRATLVAATAGTVGVELLLLAVDHWTNGRYSIAAWPFVVTLLALGCVRAGELLARRRPRAARSFEPTLVAAAVLAVVAAECSGTLRYLASGRPDWLSVAATVARTSRSGEPIWVGNDWTRVSLGYYLARVDGAPRGTLSPRVRIAGAPPPELEADPCGVLVVAGFPERTDFDPLFLRSPAQLRFPRTDAKLLARSPNETDPWSCLPRDLERWPVERPPRGLAALSAPPLLASRRLDLERADAGQLLFGWSFLERDRQGRPFRWAQGEWAAARLAAQGATRLRLKAWAFGGERRVTLFLDRVEFARLVLGGRPADYEIELPAGAGRADETVVHFRFDGWAAPDRNPRPLAAAFATVELAP